MWPFHSLAVTAAGSWGSVHSAAGLRSRRRPQGLGDRGCFGTSATALAKGMGATAPVYRAMGDMAACTKTSVTCEDDVLPSSWGLLWAWGGGALVPPDTAGRTGAMSQAGGAAGWVVGRVLPAWSRSAAALGCGIRWGGSVAGWGAAGWQDWRPISTRMAEKVGRCWGSVARQAAERCRIKASPEPGGGRHLPPKPTA